MKLFGCKFSFDEVKAFQKELDGTVAERMLFEVREALKNELKRQLQDVRLNVDQIRVVQGQLLGLKEYQSRIGQLLSIDEGMYEAGMAMETKEANEEEAENDEVDAGHGFEY